MSDATILVGGETITVKVGGDLGVPIPSAFGQAGKFMVAGVDGSLEWASGTGADAGLRTDLAADDGATLSGYRGTLGTAIIDVSKALDALGAHPLKWGWDGLPSGDGGQYVQMAADDLLAFDRPPPLLIPGRVNVVDPIMIDRATDTSQSEFRIIGIGEGGGFYCADEMAVFDSTLAPTPDVPNPHGYPVSEFLTMQDVYFEGVAGQQTYSHSQKFLRAKFVNCYWHRMNCVTSEHYAQEWTFFHCIARYFPGTFFTSAGAFRIIDHGGKYQAGFGGAFDFEDVDLLRGINGCSFTDPIFEGSEGSFIRGGFANKLHVTGLYAEGNGFAALDFSTAGSNHTITVMGCYLAPKEVNGENAAFADIIWGETASAVSIGNKTTAAVAALHDDSLLIDGALASLGDNATVKTLSGKPVDVLPTGFERAHTNITAHAGGGAGSAVQITAPFAHIAVSVTNGDSVKIPAAVTGGAGRVRRQRIVNAAAHAVDVFPKGTDTIQVVTTAFSIPSGKTQDFDCFNDGNWTAYPSI